MVGRVADISKVCGQGWRSAGDVIYLLGLPAALNTANQAEQLTLGGSEYLAVLHQTIAGRPPVVDFELERRVQSACREGIRQGWVRSAHDCAEGGLAVALAEACISGKLGAEINLANQEQAAIHSRWDSLLFAEGGARILVSVAPEAVSDWELYLDQLQDCWQRLGVVGGKNLQIKLAGQTLIDLPVETMQSTWAEAIERRLAD
jgi:phosphoribosylformylglycinamidine synthase